jgi:hypothetical protein
MGGFLMWAVRILSLCTKEKIWHINYNNKTPSNSTDKESECLSELTNNRNTDAVYQSVFITN